MKENQNKRVKCLVRNNGVCVASMESKKGICYQVVVNARSSSFCSPKKLTALEAMNLSNLFKTVVSEDEVTIKPVKKVKNNVKEKKSDKITAKKKVKKRKEKEESPFIYIND